MALSLVTATANINGSYTPSALVNGFFDLTVQGDTTIHAPTGLNGNGQIIGFVLTWDDAYTLTWDEEYIGAGFGSNWPASAGYTGQKALILAVCAAGKIGCLACSYYSA
jgi:hypothetical protein